MCMIGLQDPQLSCSPQVTNLFCHPDTDIFIPRDLTQELSRLMKVRNTYFVSLSLYTTQHIG